MKRDTSRVRRAFIPLTWQPCVPTDPENETVKAVTTAGFVPYWDHKGRFRLMMFWEHDGVWNEGRGDMPDLSGYFHPYSA